MHALDRRRFIATGLATSAASLTGDAATVWRPYASGLLPRFTDSAVVCLFAWAFSRAAKLDMPHPLADAILGVMPEIVSNLDPDSPLSPVEQRRAVYFARIANSVVAPYALRRAGYDDLARACEIEPFPPARAETCAAGLAARVIGKENLMGTKQPAAIRDSAHGACGAARNAQGSIASGELRCLYGAAQDCAFALHYVRQNDEVRRIDPAADNWVWDIGAAAIEQAMSIS